MRRICAPKMCTDIFGRKQAAKTSGKNVQQIRQNFIHHTKIMHNPQTHTQCLTQPTTVNPLIPHGTTDARCADSAHDGHSVRPWSGLLPTRCRCSGIQPTNMSHPIESQTSFVRATLRASSRLQVASGASSVKTAQVRKISIYFNVQTDPPSGHPPPHFFIMQSMSARQLAHYTTCPTAQ